MSTNIVASGCITSADINDTGFVSYSDFIGNVNSLEDCITAAEKYGNLCSAKNGSDKCTYVAYRDGEIEDSLKKAAGLYDKSQHCQTEAEKNKYLNQSLDLFKKIWLNYTPEERRRQLNSIKPDEPDKHDNPSQSNTSGKYFPFLENYARWIRDNPTYLKYFESNVNSQRQPLQMKNTCWLGGKNVLDTKYVELLDFNKNKNPNCKYGLYPVPGTEGENVAERMKMYYKQLAEDNKRKADEAAMKARTSYAMAQFVNHPDASKLDIFSLFKAAQNTKAKLELDVATKDTRASINDKLRRLEDQEKYADKFNRLAKISKKAINSNIDLVKDKQQIARKMNADLQNLNWSLEESEKKEILQNKITTTLGIIIMLFAGLCVGLMIYYLIGGTIKTDVKNKTNKGVLDNIFGLNKKGKVSLKNKKALNSIFS